MGALPEIATGQGQSSASTDLEHAVALIAEGQYSEAQKILEQLAGSTSDGQVHYQLAICYVKQRQWVQAEHALKISFERPPPPGLQAIFLNAFILFHRARYSESLAVISDYLEKDPGNAEAHKVKGLNYFMLGMASQAEAELQRATELGPQDFDSYYYLGRVFFSRSNMPGALASFEKAIQLSPDSVKAYNHLGQTLEGLAKFSAAREAYLKAIVLEQQQAAKSQWPYYNLGLLYLKEGRMAEAIDSLRKSKSKNPSWPDGMANLAKALISAGKLEEALLQLKESLQIDPNHADTHYQLGRLLSKTDKREEARQHFLLFEKLRKP
jgi:tetratricopeptide (TPR) repeat protein